MLCKFEKSNHIPLPPTDDLVLRLPKLYSRPYILNGLVWYEPDEDIPEYIKTEHKVTLEWMSHTLTHNVVDGRVSFINPPSE